MFAKLLARLKSDPFYRHALMFTVASLGASVLNYLYYPVMGHLIGVASYGELQVITSFILQLTTVFVSLNLINVNLIANHDEAEGTPLMAALQKAIFWFIVVICIGLALVSGFLRDYFHFSSVWPFLLIIPVLIVDVISVFWTGYLQGHRDFFSLSAYSISTASGKILFSVALVLLGLGVAGGILGISLGLVLSLFLIRFTARHPLPSLRQTLLWPSSLEITLIRSHLVYIAEVIIALIATSALLSIDVLLVKHLFPAHFAGQYAGVATVARIIFFASAPLVTVMLPSITLKSHSASRAAFRRTLGLSAFVCTGGLIVFSLFPNQLLTLLLGSAFASSSSWLPLLSIVAVLVTLTNIMVNYLLALRSHWATAVSMVSLVVAIPLILLYHDTIPQLVTSTSIGLVCGQIVFWVVFLTPALNRRQVSTA